MKKATLFSIIALIVSVLMVSGCVNQQQEQKNTTTGEETQEETGGTISGTSGQLALVELTDSGYNPQTITIKKGGIVKWTNLVDSPDWPASAVHPTHLVYPGKTGKCASIGGSDFDACQPLNKGDSYEFTFNQVGEWKYHNHLNPSQTGTVVVTE